MCPHCLDSVNAFSAECCCQRCGAPFLSTHALDEDGVCRLCRTGRRGFDACYAYGSYQGELRHLIHVFKYERVESLTGTLTRHLLKALPRHIPFDVIVPVPMHWWKRFRRGFNQAEHLARGLSQKLQIPVAQPLRRVRLTQVQAGLTNKQRRQNALASFALRSGEAASPRSASGKAFFRFGAKIEDLQGKQVLLVDDVFTTGATATACARLLKKAGAAKVTVLTIARVDRRAPVPAAFRSTHGQENNRSHKPDAAQE